MPSDQKKVPVSERALFARVKRRLAKDGEHLRRCRSDSRWWNNLGSYYTVNDFNAITDTHMDLESWARELDLLKPWEEMIED